MQNYKKILILFLVLAFGGFLLYKFQRKTPEVVVVPEVKSNFTHKVLGKSVEGRDIEAFVYGTGSKNILFVGGVHGGYEWNSVLLSYKLIDYLDKNPQVVSDDQTVIVIPNLNPDGVYRVIGKEGRFTEAEIPQNKDMSAGRFNANGVDLNRNFDCKWQPKSTWQNKTVSAGTKPFSEPESLILKKYIEDNKPLAVVFWHSQGGAVYASECTEGILSETLEIMNAYSKASGYPADPTYDAYQTTGDADSWLARIGIPAITVELKTHSSVEWEQNLSGIKAILKYYK